MACAKLAVRNLAAIVNSARNQEFPFSLKLNESLFDAQRCQSHD